MPAPRVQPSVQSRSSSFLPPAKVDRSAGLVHSSPGRASQKNLLFWATTIASGPCLPVATAGSRLQAPHLHALSWHLPAEVWPVAAFCAQACQQHHVLHLLAELHLPEFPVELVWEPWASCLSHGEGSQGRSPTMASRMPFLQTSVLSEEHWGRPARLQQGT